MHLLRFRLPQRGSVATKREELEAAAREARVELEKLKHEDRALAPEAMTKSVH
jgi:hypothetical protein